MFVNISIIVLLHKKLHRTQELCENPLEARSLFYRKTRGFSYTLHKEPVRLQIKTEGMVSGKLGLTRATVLNVL